MDEREIIRKIESLPVEEDVPFLRILQVGGEIEECALEGNSDGLRKMAAGLLKLSLGDEKTGLEELNHESSDIFFSYCSKRKGIAPTAAEEYKESIKDKVVAFLIMCIVFTIPIFWTVGLIKSISWMLGKI